MNDPTWRQVEMETLAEIEKRYPSIYWEIIHDVVDRNQVQLLKAELQLVKQRGGELN